MDKHKELSFWIVFGKTLKSLIIRYDNFGSWWFRARPVFFFGAIWLIGFFSYHGYIYYMDHSLAYPKSEQIFLDKGRITEVKISRQYFLEFVKENGEKILFRDGYKNVMHMLYKDGKNIYIPATLRWFMLPSGKGWISELWIEDKLFIDTKYTKKLFESDRNKYGSFSFSLFSFIFLFWIIISEYRYVKNKLSEEVKNGK